MKMEKEPTESTPSIPELYVSREGKESVGTPEDGEPKAVANDTHSIPNGGLKAWLQVAGTFFIFFNTW